MAAVIAVMRFNPAGTTSYTRTWTRRGGLRQISARGRGHWIKPRKTSLISARWHRRQRPVSFACAQAGAPGQPGVTIRAEGPAGLYSAQTDAAGVAAFLRLQPGEYSIHQESDGDLPSDPKVQVYAKGCVEVTLLRTLELVGRVTAKDGSPAARIEVEIRSARGQEASTMTDAYGRYQLKVSRSGEYQLGVNLTHTATLETPYPRWFYPGTEDPLAAATIEFLGRPDTRTYDFVLPAQQNERTIEGFVRMTDGRPAPAARLFALDSSLAVVAHEIAAANGHFSLRVFAGVPYELHAVWPGNSPAEAASAVPADIPAGGGPLALRLTLDQAGNSFADATQNRSLTRP